MMQVNRFPLYFIVCSFCALLFQACANVGTPDGGEYDEQPPRLLRTSPVVNAVNWQGRKVELYFDEYVRVVNATEKVIVSPPQIEPPSITMQPSKRITIELREDLQPDVTYTIDFSDAIVDNNEDNPFGSFAFTFSTGASVDTFEVSGHVLDAENLDPVKGIYVGAYLVDEEHTDSVFRTKPLARVSRTDESGYFCIRGLKETARYQIVALQDGDQNFMFNQKSEQIAFLDSFITTSAHPHMRADTVWRDSLTIDSIRHVSYTHYYPDDLVLRAFKEDAMALYLLKAERLAPTHFQVYFSAPSPQLPTMTGLNFDAEDAFLLEKTLHNDTLTYWLRDTLLCQTDTLHLAMEYWATDTLGMLSLTTDTLELPIRRRATATATTRSTSRRDDENAPPPPPPTLSVQVTPNSRMEIENNIVLTFPEPITGFPDSIIQLTEQAPKDTIAYPKPFLLRADTLNLRRFVVLAEWNPGHSYAMHIDTAAIQGIYGLRTKAIDWKATMKQVEEYATSLTFNITGLQDSAAFVELLSETGNVTYTMPVENNKVEFFFLKPGKYYARLVSDRNNNGKWDVGLYPNTQPEEVFYFSKLLELRVLWTAAEDWDLYAVPFDRQKPEALKPKRTDTKKRESRNATRHSH